MNFSGQTSEKKKFKYQISWKPSSGSRVVRCRRTDRQADMTKLTVGFGNFAKAPKYQTPCPVGLFYSTFRRAHIPALWPPVLIGILHGFPQPSTALATMIYSVDSSPLDRYLPAQYCSLRSAGVALYAACPRCFNSRWQDLDKRSQW
jgi:hypothetical protein